MRSALWVMLFGALLGFIASFVIESGYRARAGKAQIVRIDPKSKSPFGPVTVDVGEPVELIVGDPHALLKNKTPLGYPIVDSEYASKHAGSVIRLDSIQAPIFLARLGCAISAVVSLIGFAMLARLRVAIDPPNGVG